MSSHLPDRDPFENIKQERSEESTVNHSIAVGDRIKRETSKDAEGEAADVHTNLEGGDRIKRELSEGEVDVKANIDGCDRMTEQNLDMDGVDPLSVVAKFEVHESEELSALETILS